MKVIICFVALTAVALAAPQQGPEAKIINLEDENLGIEGYRFRYETSDPIVREESGEYKNVGSENEAVAVQGTYTYTLPNGKTHTVTFVADENGYRPHTQTS